jgi:hypothetical protein
MNTSPALRAGSRTKNTVKSSRQVIMQAVPRTGDVAWYVEFTIDNDFVERLRQLRSLVPAYSSMSKKRDLVIDKVRARLREARWQPSRAVQADIDGSCIVFAADGTFSCAAKNRATEERLQTYYASIEDLLIQHESLPASETLLIRGRTISALPANTVFDKSSRGEPRSRRKLGISCQLLHTKPKNVILITRLISRYVRC